MSKRAYPRKAESEKRVVISFSLSGIMLEQFRNKLAEHMHLPVDVVTVEDIRGQVRELALQAVEEYNATPVPPDPEWDEAQANNGS